ncbi:MAG: polysaccharide deacetylase family protein [bacterium]|nr:polysaccharide deacetylase family protein [bacterium]
MNISNQFVKRITAGAVGISLAVAQFASVMINPAYAAQIYTPQGTVALTFDDATVDTYTKAVPILSSRGIKGVLYDNTGYNGKSGYLTWAQVQELQNKYGWEIGGHSVTHPLMTTLSASQLKTEVEQSKKDLVDHGINPVSFATPYGDYDNKVIAAIAKQYYIHRPFHDREQNNVYPYNSYLIQVQSVEKVTTFAQVKGWIDNAKATNTALVLVFHTIVTRPSDQYDVSESMLKQVADYIKSSGIKVNQVKDLAQMNTPNLFQNSSFEQGMNIGWTTDNATSVKIDTNTNGSMPAPKNSVVMSGSASVSHLFAPTLAVKPNETYVVKAFTNQSSFTNGEYGYYLNEYDSAGNWISGRWIFGNFDNDTNNSNDVFQVSFKYQPTSDLVASAMLEVYMTAGSAGKVYIDNIELYKVYTDTSSTPVPSAIPTVTPVVTPTVQPSAIPTASASATPTAQPSITPTATASATPVASVTPTPSMQPTAQPSVQPSATPSGTNLVRNSNMGAAESGFALYWKGNDSSIVYDTTSKGCSGAESIIMKANNTVNAVLINTKYIAVDSAKSYDWLTCVKVGTGSGEFGYYIDEYDANNIWISGKWMGMAAPGTRTDWFVYTPSSSAVKYAGIQYYKTAGSTFEVNVDKIGFYVK